MNENRLLFRIPIFHNDKFIGFEYHDVKRRTVLCDVLDKTDCENWTFGEWEQCIGCCDINKKLVYENDILSAKPEQIGCFGVAFKVAVKWDNNDLNWIFVEYHGTDSRRYEITEYRMGRTYEVVGNIHQKDNQ